MELTKQEYDVSYVIVSGLVRSSASGKFEGNDYSPSVRITSSNVYDVENKQTGFTDSIEQKVVFKILCPDNQTAGKVAEAIKAKLKKGEPLRVKGGFPAGDQRIISLYDSWETFLKPSDLKTADKSASKA